MKIIYNKILPIKGYAAINLFGVVFARKEYDPISERIKNHEAIHTAQMKEMLYIFFYLWYGVEYLFRLVQYRNTNKAYRNISFEKETYSNDRNLEYLKNRKLFSWLR